MTTDLPSAAADAARLDVDVLVVGSGKVAVQPFQADRWQSTEEANQGRHVSRLRPEAREARVNLDVYIHDLAVSASRPRERQRLLDAHRVAHEAEGPLAEQHVAGPGGLLEPRSDVDRVAGHECLAACAVARDDLAGVDADPQGDACPEALLEILVQGAEARLHLECGAARAQGVVLVLPPGDVWDGVPVDAVVAGGLTRSASVRAGLTAVPLDADVVLVHDSAHPLASAELIASVLRAVADGADGAAPGLPLTDALKHVDGGLVVGHPPKHGLVLEQVPYAFRADVLRRAHDGEPEAVEDVELACAVGAHVVVVPGDPRNVHITNEIELGIARLIATS